MRLTDLFKEQQEILACSGAQIEHLDSQVRIFKLINLAHPMNSLIENLSESDKVLVPQPHQQLSTLQVSHCGTTMANLTVTNPILCP